MLLPIRSLTVIAVSLLATIPQATRANSFKANFDGYHRPWIGPEFWAGPLQDWRLNDDRAECFVSGANRLLFLTTHEVKEAGDFSTTVRLGRLQDDANSPGWGGLRFGINGTLPDYRRDLRHRNRRRCA